MRTSGIVILSIAGFGFALWLARGSDPPKTSVTPTAAAATTNAPAASALPRPFAPARATTASGAVAAERPVAKLNPKSAAYARRMDDQIPTHLYAEASHCYKGGGKRDDRLDLTYRIRVSNGSVGLFDVRVSDSTLADTQLERCILDTVSHAVWRDDQLPDLQEEGDLDMRVAGFTAYLANADDDDAVGGNAMN
jgi:hypothetical protein